MFLELIQYDFIQRAYIAGSFIAFLCGILGLFLILRRLSLIGDGISHVSFGAIALGLFFGFYPFYIAIPTVIIASYLILKITEKTKLHADAAIGIVSSAGISLGVILSSISGGFNIDLFSYLFGNILAISKEEMYLSVFLSAFLLIVIYYLYYEFFSVSFDEEYAKTTGINTKRINVILITLTALTVILAIRIVGVMLSSALLILPGATSLLFAKSFKFAIFFSGILSLISVFLGITFAFYLNLPPGATIIVLNLIFFSFFSVYRKINQ
ncbi:MAG: metal ABC transporter permease [Candidatus Pacebacteria bacterium]|nr:metal ABC transporter permease [Candidatus Paceibacterota bacterium]